MLEWLTNYGQIIGFFVQLAYFIVLSVAAVWAVLLFKRLVDYQTGKATAKDTEKSEDKGAKAVKVEDFVD